MVFIKKTKEYMLHLDAKEEVFRSAHALRHQMTEAETVLWEELKGRNLNGLKFRRQHPVNRYIADFYCHEKKLVIEVDGGIHEHNSVIEHDENRSAELERLGICVVRFTNDQVLNNIKSVINKIREITGEDSVSNDAPSPSGEGAGG
ncbi:MAG: endonuclease domain-containing protein [Bacteroidetes bacterium]|nr:endonuclease domain-containing protein [Bacteroidota bacterium]